MSVMRTGGERNSSIVEMYKHTKLERGDTEEQVAKPEGGNYTPATSHYCTVSTASVIKISYRIRIRFEPTSTVPSLGLGNLFYDNICICDKVFSSSFTRLKHCIGMRGIQTTGPKLHRSFSCFP